MVRNRGCEDATCVFRASRKRGQAAIWIILAVILVASILLFFMFIREPQIIGTTGDLTFEMQAYLESEITERVEEVVDVMLPQGGFVEPQNSIFFNNTNIEYICKNIGYYHPCIHQHPMLLNDMKEEIRDYIYADLTQALDDLERDFERAGAQVERRGTPTIEVDLVPDKILIDIEQDMTVVTEEESRNFEGLQLEIKSPAYNLGSIALEIATQEATYCNFEYLGYTLIYPRYKITKYQMSRPTKIYMIQDRDSGKAMQIAIRSCAFPSGFPS